MASSTVLNEISKSSRPCPAPALREAPRFSPLGVMAAVGSPQTLFIRLREFPLPVACGVFRHARVSGFSVILLCPWCEGVFLRCLPLGRRLLGWVAHVEPPWRSRAKPRCALVSNPSKHCFSGSSLYLFWSVVWRV